MDEQRLLHQKQHLTAPGTPDSMSETEIDESKTAIVGGNLCITFCLHLNGQLAIQKHLIAGSHKSRYHLQVDVEMILSTFMAIRLQHALKKLQVDKNDIAHMHTWKRQCKSLEWSLLPMKRKRFN